MAIVPSSFAPRTPADAARIVRNGCRDVKGAARFTGLTCTEIWWLLKGGLLWSFKRGKRRLIPVTELQRYMAKVVEERIEDEQGGSD